jgi:hypothetical protein
MRRFLHREYCRSRVVDRTALLLLLVLVTVLAISVVHGVRALAL